MSKYLFIGAHVDDVELCCGGTIARLIEEKNEVTMLTLSHKYARANLLSEWEHSISVLKPLHALYRDLTCRSFPRERDWLCDELYALSKQNYDFVFTHSEDDIHQDHCAVGEESLRVFRNSNILTYCADWNTRVQRKNTFYKLNQSHIEKKLEALDSYKSQYQRNYMQKDYILSNARNNGVICGAMYAEGFQTINLVI